MTDDRWRPAATSADSEFTLSIDEALERAPGAARRQNPMKPAAINSYTYKDVRDKGRRSLPVKSV